MTHLLPAALMASDLCISRMSNSLSDPMFHGDESASFDVSAMRRSDDSDHVKNGCLEKGFISSSNEHQCKPYEGWWYI
jgi:hypothetical protein